MDRATPLVLLLVAGLSQSSPQISTNQVVRTVTTQLQPLISDAVAAALLGASGGLGSAAGAASGGLSEQEEAEYNKKLSANAQYEYGYKVADDETQSYMSHEETRNGQNVEGKYNYVDANGALVTVNYQAGPEGYTENREVQDGAVEMRTTYGPWSGPFADTVPAGVSATAADVSQSTLISSRGSSSSSQQSSAVSQADLIAQILSAVQPQINSAVQSALSSSTRSVSSSSSGASSGSSVQSALSSSVVGSRQSSSAVGQSQSVLISNIIGALQPQISGAVQAALSTGRQTSVSYRPTRVLAVQPAPVLRPARVVQPVPIRRLAPAAASSGLTGIFGV